MEAPRPCSHTSVILQRTSIGATLTNIYQKTNGKSTAREPGPNKGAVLMIVYRSGVVLIQSVADRVDDIKVYPNATVWRDSSTR